MTHTHHAWLPVLASLCEREIPCVLVTVMEAKGSTPREAGTKMVVTTDTQFETIGGGNLEFQAIEQARSLLERLSQNAEVKKYPLGPALAQCCGGSVTVLLEPFIKTGKLLLLFGAGHVGKEVVKVLEGLPLKIRWVDERAEEFPETVPGYCEKVVTATPVAELRDIPDGAFILIMTHSHDLDLDLTKAALENGRFAYLGLIGSKTKRVKFEKRLKACGINDNDLSRLTCPVGIGSVMGKHPREIAVSVVAELLSLGLTHFSEAHDVEKAARIS